MKREDMKQWLDQQLLLQKQLVTGASVAMLVIGIATVLLELMLFCLILRIGFIESLWRAMLATLMILAGIQYLVAVRFPKDLPNRQYRIEFESEELVVRTFPAMSVVWTYTLGSLESDQSWLDRLAGILTLPQRMCMAAWYSWKRREHLMQVDTHECAGVFRLLHKENTCVDISDLIRKARLSNPEKTFGEVSLFDGVLFLPRKTSGLSLANRVLEDINDWYQKRHGLPE